ncbi:MAG: BON domain-containing protein [Phenylobacterium sp.]|nr:BON domain-containing protein [Phenylobacterium sp.]
MREDWRDLEAQRLRRLHERDDPRYDRGGPGYERPLVQNDYGQADYSDRYGYDPRSRTGYRVTDEDRRGYEDRHFRDSPAELGRRSRRDGPSDGVLWAVVTERLDAERRLDLRDVQVDVIDGEVILDGTVRHKADKRRIEDVADIDGVRNVQNNLRVRERGRWTFF